MVWQSVRSALLVGAVVAVAGLPARADDCCAPAAPCTRTVCCTEWVPETYPCTRTVYRTECKQEAYTAYRCECVPEARTRTCTVYKFVPECRTEMRTVCECVPVCEERTVMQTFTTCKPVTCMARRCVDRGHWECREVPCSTSKKHSFFGHKKDCCCDPCCPPPTKTVKVWVPCKVWEEYPVTKMERVCETRPVTHKVTVYKQVQKQVAVQVTCNKCVPEQRVENYTVMVSRTVPYQCTRTVAVCVPHQETVTMTRMVARTVTKEVPVETCCAAPSCGTTCCKPAKHHRCSGLHSRSSCCCD